jgi:hypothetical protein
VSRSIQSAINREADEIIQALSAMPPAARAVTLKTITAQFWNQPGLCAAVLGVLGRRLKRTA